MKSHPSTPVIDPNAAAIRSRQTKRARLCSKATCARCHYRPRSLVVRSIQASVPGTGDGTTTVTFNSLRENQRTGLLLSTESSIWDSDPTGHQSLSRLILAYNATSLQQCSLRLNPDGSAGRHCRVAEAWPLTYGNVFFAAGMRLDANTGAGIWIQSKTSPSGTLWTIHAIHQAFMSSTNIELGSAGPVMLLDQPGRIRICWLVRPKWTIYVVIATTWALQCE